jgi:hypothetical protein
MIRTLAVKKTSNDAWEANKSIHISSDRARKTTLQQLRKEWELLSFRDGEHVDDFSLRLSGLMSSLNIYVDTINKQRAIEKLLRVVPKKYSQIAMSIDSAWQSRAHDRGGDWAAGEDPDDTPPQSAPDQPLLSDGKLYFTEEQWLARMKQRRDGEGSSKPPKSNGNGRCRSRGARKKQTRALDTKDGGNDDNNGKCLNWGCFGHWAKDCCKPKKAQAHLNQADGDNEEPTLPMARVCALSVAPDGVHLKEPHAQAFLGAADNDVEHLDGWYLDTGATNHMTCHMEVFSDLDQSMVGSVNFDDSSVVSI